jgi:hypothetical protein
MISSKDILNGKDGLSFPSPRLCREMMVYLFHRYSSGYGSEAMRQRYADEEKMFIPKLASVFTKMSMDAQTAESENDRKDRLVRRRSTLRLLAELLVAGVYTDGSILITALRDLIEQESKAIFADARTMFFTIVSVTKRNLNRGSTLPNNAWDALLHELDNNWSLFPEKTLLYLDAVTPRSLSLSVTVFVMSHCLTLTLAASERHRRTVRFKHTLRKSSRER